jgi:hypothetical protein
MYRQQAHPSQLPHAGWRRLVRDDLDVVDPLKHDRLPNFVDRASSLSKQL